MGVNVHINVCFACDENESLAALATKHLSSGLDHREARWFLEDLSKRSGANPGTKGGLCTWGMVGNYLDGEGFVVALLPFWSDLLTTGAGPLPFEHILVFVEREQTEKAGAFEIYLQDEENPSSLAFKSHDCPFTWMQF